MTELGEKELTESVRSNFDSLKKNLLTQDVKTTNYTISMLNNYLYGISEMNTPPIIHKNQEAEKTADDAIFLMALIVTFCFLFSFSFIFNFPSYIANPIKELTEGIKKVADKNYNERLHFTSNDEFGELATAFNTMAQRLDAYEHSNLARIISEKQRIETIIDGMNDPLMGLDENNKILFVNTEGCAVLGLTKENLMGQYAPDVALKNDLLRTLLTNTTDKTLKIFANNRENHFEKAILNITAKDKAIGKVIVLRNITQFQERDAQNTHFISSLFYELNKQAGIIAKNMTAFETECAKSFDAVQYVQFQHIKEDIMRFTTVLNELMQLNNQNSELDV